ncbi:MAG: hypothetical protein OEY23_03570 [Acidimicrobiia bacterium]|nr:hypothetical protein [Acidimicrobiia bacterium]
MKHRAFVVILAGAVLVAAGCGGSDDSSQTATADFRASAPAPSAAEPASATTATSATPTTARPATTTSAGATASGDKVAMSGSLWLAGLELFPKEARYDAAANEVEVDVEVRNTWTDQSDLINFLGSLSVVTPSGPSTYAGTVDSIVTPASSTSRGTLTFAVPKDFAFATSRLVAGTPTEQQWTMPFAPGSKAEGVAPRDVGVAGEVEAGGLAFRIARTELVPFACDRADAYGPGETGRLTFKTTAKSKLGLVMTGDIVARSANSGGNAIGAVTLSLPDGTTAPTVSSSGIYNTNESTSDWPLCFTVPAPGPGAYVLNWVSYDGQTTAFPFTIPG